MYLGCKERKLFPDREHGDLATHMMGDILFHLGANLNKSLWRHRWSFLIYSDTRVFTALP